MRACLANNCDLTRRLYHTHTLLHTNLLHTNALALLHVVSLYPTHATDAFTQDFLHTFWHVHERFSTNLAQTLLYTYALTHRLTYAQTRWQKDCAVGWQLK